ncbi:MAG: aspartate-semialdehyde dehydrogenase, partial [Candidatus Promineifilaceae bacterium]
MIATPSPQHNGAMAFLFIWTNSENRLVRPVRSNEMSKIRVGILAATGSVGQRFVQLLVDHPWFEIAAVTGSPRTAGRPYIDGVNWLLDGKVPEKVANMVVQPTEPNLDVDIIFSALPTSEARELEPKFAEAGYPVLTNASP